MRLTALNDIQDIVKNEDGTFTLKVREHKSKAGTRLVEADWREVPHYSKKGELLDPDDFAQQTIDKYGKQYHAQVNECAFLGSAATLISTEALTKMEPIDPFKKDHLFPGLKTYKLVEENHNYILSVDPAKDGIDDFSLQVIDITKFPFEQVASAHLQVDYLMMPEHLETLGQYYNNAFIVIENNEGAGQSINDIMYMQYEYENMYRDRDPQDKKYKRYFGFRTTPKSRPLIINMMKVFIEEGKLKVHDRKTIDQFFNFIKNDNNKIKYAAEEGYRDDAVMSLALAFAPFMNIKAFDSLEIFLAEIRVDIEDGEDGAATSDFYSMLDTSGMDDGTDDGYSAAEALAAVRGGDFGSNDQFMSAMDTLRG